MMLSGIMEAIDHCSSALEESGDEERRLAWFRLTEKTGKTDLVGNENRFFDVSVAPLWEATTKWAYMD